MTSLGYYFLALAVLAGSNVAESGLRPAPGFRFGVPKALQLGAARVALDATGAGKIQPNFPLSATGFRFYRVAPSGNIFYFPEDFTLLSLPVDDQLIPLVSELIVKTHGRTWREAESFPVEREKGAKSAQFRCALPPGIWDLALLVPGRSPVIITELKSGGLEKALPKQTLRPAGTVVGQIRDGKTSQPIKAWMAYVKRIGKADNGEVDRFFQERPVPSDPKTLHFASLPVGAWEIRIEAAGYASRRQVLSPVVASGAIDLGNIFLSRAGALSISILFPVALPSKDLTVSVFRSDPSTGKKGELLVSRLVEPGPEPAVRFDNLDPEQVTIVFSAPLSGLIREVPVVVEANNLASFTVTFSPVEIRGTVLRKKSPAEAVRVKVSREGIGVEAVSGPDGQYSLHVWSPGLYFLTATPPGMTIPRPETLFIDDDISAVEHDIALPGNSVLGTVSDETEGTPVAGATLLCSKSASTSPGGDSDLSFSFAVESDKDGRYILDNLDPNELEITASAEGYVAKKLKRILPSEEGTNLDISLKKGLTLKGWVLDDNGHTLSGATVGIDYDILGDSFADQADSSASGEFEFDGVAPGNHYLFVHKCGYRLGIQSVDPAAPPQVRTVVLSSKLNPLTLHFEDSKATPVIGYAVTLAINGVMLPKYYPILFSKRCGQRGRSDGDGNLSMDFLPDGDLRAFDLDRGQYLGNYRSNDLRTLWTIRVEN